ncbi:multicopper oxidase family protein [Xylogone sp. PMI_703]|nr:multicopper oxidase family protein [Xylogone sp. PMI_703]
MDCEAAAVHLHHAGGRDRVFGSEKDRRRERYGILQQTPGRGTFLALVFGSLCLIIIIVATGLQRPARYSTLLDFIQHTGAYSPETEVEKYVSIDLHPEDHIYRPPTTITLNWTVTSDYHWPDGVRKKVYMVNGQFPGPTIECRQGDKLIVHVTNALTPGEKCSIFAASYALAEATEGISIHWHGLQMRDSNHMDGAVGVTQCPIPAGESYTYEFDVGDQAGTFWWHAHSAVYRADGLFGGLVIHKSVEKNTVTDLSEYGYEKEALLMIGDWYHKAAEDVLEWYTRSLGLVEEPSPDSLLINGAGKFICSMAVPANPVECTDIPDEQLRGILGRHLIDVPTRLRIVNVGTLAGLTVAVNEGTLTPLTVDGGSRILGTPAQSVGILYPGERMDLLFQWTQNLSSSAQLEVKLDPENFNYPNFALRPNQAFPLLNTITSAPEPSSKSKKLVQTEVAPHFDLSQAQSFSNLSHSPKQPDEVVLLYTKSQQLTIHDYHVEGFMNRTSWRPQSSPLLSIPRKSWDKNQLIPWISHTPETTYQTQDQKRPGKWVDIILNNLDDGSHPFHLHGYSFYVLYSYRSEHGWGSYTPYSTPSGGVPSQLDLNLVDPLLKDTVAVPRRGFVVLRIWADNPGIWMFHCHVLFHQASGMAMGFAVGGVESHENVDTRSVVLCRN